MLTFYFLGWLFLIGSAPIVLRNWTNNSGADRHEQADEHGNMVNLGGCKLIAGLPVIMK